MYSSFVIRLKDRFGSIKKTITSLTRSSLRQAMKEKAAKYRLTILLCITEKIMR
jgi:hypothetical protein